METKTFDLIVIGAGPAGMTAAIYGSRAGLHTAMIESGAPGGKLLKTFKIANYPGTPDVNGADLAATMFEQSTAFGAEYVYGDVVEITKDKEVKLADGTVYKGKAVIVATGTQEAMMGIPGERANVGHGVSFCAVCDGAFFRDQPVAVVGGNNSALEETAFLSQFASKIYIVVRGDDYTAEPSNQQLIEGNDKIEKITNAKPVEVLSEKGKVTGLVIEDAKMHTQRTLDVKGIFPYEGENPMSSALVSLDVVNTRGYVVVDENRMTKVPGIYAAGDIVDKDLRQVVTATNDGAIAAQHINRMIKMKKYQ